MAKVTAIIRSAGFFLFGVGLAALGIMLPTSQLFEFAHEMLASLLPNVGGEFAADSLEKSLDHMFSAHEKAKFLKGFQEGLLKEETLKKIFGELKESMKAGNTDSEQRGIVKKFFDQLKSRRIEKEFWENIFVNIESSDAVLQESETFRGLEDGERKLVSELFACAKRKYLYESAQERDIKLVLSSLMMLREEILQMQDAFAEVEEAKKGLGWFIGSAVPRVHAQYGEGATLQRIVYASRYERKYTVRECPVCGYNGSRIYTDPKTNLTTCAACGSQVSLLEYSEPELYERLSAMISGEVDHILEGVDLLSQISDETRGEIKSLVENSLTREEMKRLFEDYHQDFLSKVTENKESGERYIKTLIQREILPHLEDLKGKSEEDRTYQTALIRQMKSFCEQMSEMHKYAREQLGDLKELRLLVENLCTKEYFQERTSVLSEDVRKAIKFGFENSQAITESGVAQILAKLDGLKKEGGQDNTERLEQLIREENMQLSGKIVGLQKLVESCNKLIRDGEEKNVESFRQIIERLTEIRDLQLGVNFVAGFKGIYEGKVPDKYLIDEGFEEEFPCLYCGAVAVHETNEDQVCKCTVCGNKYKKIAIGFLPTLIKDGRVDPQEEYIATEENTRKWREKHTVTCKGYALQKKNSDGNSITDGIYIIPNIGESCPGRYDFSELYHSATTLIFHENLKNIQDGFFSKFQRLTLKNIVITKGQEGWKFIGRTIDTDEDVHVYGKTKNGFSIKSKKRT